MDRSTRWIGVVSIWALFGWWIQSRLLLSNEGLHGNADLSALVGYRLRWSIFDALSSPIQVRLGLVLGLCAALAVVFGRRRCNRSIGLVVLFVTFASLNARAPYALSSAEMYLTVLVFWFLVVNLFPSERGVISAARLQVAMVYTVPLIIRFTRGGDTWINGSAVRRVVENPSAAHGPLAGLVEQLPGGVLRVSTWGVLVVEVCLAVLLAITAILPSQVSSVVRRRGLVAGIVLHALIGLVCGLWFFSAVAVLGLSVLLLPDGTERRLGSWISVLVIVCILSWNVRTIATNAAVAASRFDDPTARVVRGLGLTQVWSVYSPNPPRDERWVEIREGSEVVVDSRHEGDRIRKLAQNVATSRSSTLAGAWLKSTCSPEPRDLVVVRSSNGNRAEEPVAAEGC
jgi:hypothetical protein